jgi:protease-4
MSKPNIIVRFFRFIWRLLGFIRQAIQLLLLLVFLAVLVAVFSAGPQLLQVPDSAALVVAPSGVLVDQLEGDEVSRALANLQGLPPRETLVRSLRELLEHAAEDDRIKVVVLDLDEFAGGGLAQLQTVADALVQLRASGKKVIARGDAYTQAQYYLAAHADEVYVNELGAVVIEGFGYYRAFFREALENLSIDVNVFRVGEYKSFVEPFTRDSMSDADKEAGSRWLGSLWDAYRTDIAAARDLSPDAISAYVDEFADRVEAAEGDLARVAVEAGLVDELAVRGTLDDYLVELVGEDENGYRRIGHLDYLAAIRRENPKTPNNRRVGVVVASGQIVDGEAPPGTVGGDTLAALIRQATDDEELDALVLQVDSPGGSVFASELIFQELLAWRETGRPLIASMSSVAASGGYYIAIPADRIFAAPTTITGSIGVGAVVPTFQRGLARLGVRVDGIGTTSLAGQFQPSRELGPDARRVIQASVDNVYELFVGKVAAGRDMSVDRADSLARGRVWVGADALEMGLIDSPGGLEEAIAAAADAAGLADGDYAVDFIARPLNFREQLAGSFAVRVARWAAWLGLDDSFSGVAGIPGLLQAVGEQTAWLARFNDPGGLYYHCFCSPD